MTDPMDSKPRRSAVAGLLGILLLFLLAGLISIALVIHIQQEQLLRDLEAQTEFLAMELGLSLAREASPSTDGLSIPPLTYRRLERLLRTLQSQDERYIAIALISLEGDGGFHSDIDLYPPVSEGGVTSDWTGPEYLAELRRVVSERKSYYAMHVQGDARPHADVVVPIIDLNTGEFTAILAIAYAVPSWIELVPGVVTLIFSLTLAAMLVVVLGTLILRRSAQQSPQSMGIHSYRASFYVAMVGLFLTILIAVDADDKEADSRTRAFLQLAIEKVTAVSKSFHTLQHVEAEALARFFTASEYVTASEFAGYSDYLLINPSVNAWMWVDEVPESTRADFERRMRQEENADFAVWDQISEGALTRKGSSHLHYPVSRIASRDDYSRFYGYDCYSNARIAVAIDRASESGTATCTDPIRNELFRNNILFFKKADHRDRIRNQSGLVAGILDLERLLISAGPGYTVSLSLTSGLPVDQDSIHVSADTHHLSDFKHYTSTWPIFAFDRLFLVTAYSGPGLYDIHPIRAGIFVVSAGSLLTITFTFIALLIQRRRLLLEQLVEERSRELESTRHRAEMAVQAADIGIWDWNLLTGIVALNDSWAAKLGFDDLKDEQSVDHWRSMISPDFQERVNEVLQQHLRGETDIYEMEIPVQLSSGENLWIMSRGRVVERDSEGNPIRVNGTYLDITGRKNDEAELVNREMQIRTLFNALPDLVWLKDIDGRYLKCNHKFERFIGMSEQELIGKTDYDFFDRDLASFFRARDQAVIQAGRPLMNEEEVTYVDDGHTEILETLKTPVLDVEGKLVGVLGIARDITERKQAEAERESLQMQLVQAQKLDAIGSLAGGIAHDLNNLLVPIIGSAELLSQYGSQSAEDVESVETILNASFKARDLIRQLLAFSRKQALETKLVDLNQVVLDIRELLRRTIPENIQLHVHFSTEMKMIEADTNQIEQILMNLIVNAVDAITDQGSVTVETSVVQLDEEFSALHTDVEAGEYILLSVSDTGKGMDEETRLRVFEPFFSTKGEKGTGLGLATVFGIVKQHGGTVWVYSEPDKGTTFRIYLPVSSNQAEEKTDDESEISLAGTETILVVEDNADVRKLTAAILSKHGYRVVLAKSGQEAIELVEAMDDKVAMLLTDVVMPAMNGRELYDTLSQLIPGLRVLYMSGYTDDVIIHRGLLEREIDYIQKPFSLVDLVTKVRKTLDEKS